MVKEKTPVIIRLNGGLGNQMFQYAFGVAVSKNRDTKLLLDLRELKTDPLRTFALDSFKIQGKIATPEILRTYNPSIIHKIFIKLGFNANPNSKILMEKFFHYDTEVMGNNKADYFLGYWQTEKYFMEFENEVRNEFTIKTEALKPIVSYFEEIQNSESISLHIRRGDYVANDHTNSYHGVCSLDYYSNALNLALQGMKNPKIYIFTDDPEWAKAQNIWPVDYKIISGLGLTDIQEFHLMSSAKKNIIANSSFSWWAAWLNKSGSVYAPERWFGNAQNNTKDLIPDRWIKVKG